MKSLSKKAKVFDELILRSWWVILFGLLCYMGYEQGLRSRTQDFQTLSDQLRVLQFEMKKAAALQNNLLMQVNSQSDPGWVELTLMKGLGLVPEGHTKVLFTN